MFSAVKQFLRTDSTFGVLIRKSLQKKCFPFISVETRRFKEHNNTVG